MAMLNNQRVNYHVPTINGDHRLLPAPEQMEARDAEISGAVTRRAPIQLFSLLHVSGG